MKWEITMFSKTLIAVSTAIVVTAAATVPADAGKKARAYRPAPTSIRVYGPIPAPAYGVRADGRAHSSNPSYDVYVDNKYAGSDPDPFIRFMLQADPPWRRGR
jgi:hypothetical protein